MSKRNSQLKAEQQLARRGTRDKDKPRDKVVRITSDLFNEMSRSVLGRKFEVDFHDICSEVWEFWKEHHPEDVDEEEKKDG
jgi:hypothetical protein